MLKTQNYGFNKPELSDSPPDITVMNPNWDTIDKKIKENTDAIAQNSQEIGQKLDKESSFYADIEAYYGNTKLIDDFQDISKWVGKAGIQSSDITNSKIGNQSLKITEDGNVGRSLWSEINNIQSIDLNKFNNGELSDDNDYINIVVYISDVSKIQNMYIGLDNSPIYNELNCKRLFIGADNLVNGWNFIKFKKSNATTRGTGNWSNINSIRVLWTSLTNAQNAYVSFQLIQLVKKDPLEDKPNPFQKFGVRDFEILNGEWFIGKEFDSLVCKELSGQNLASRSLEVLPKFKDFEGNISVIPKSTIYTIGGIWVDNSNYVVITGSNSSVSFTKRYKGVETYATLSLKNLINSLVRLDIKRKGTDILIKINDSVYETTFEYLGECSLVVGCSNPANNYLENVSITEISHAHHSDLAEVAKISLEMIDRGYSHFKGAGSDLNKLFKSGKYFTNSALNKPTLSDAYLIDIIGDGSTVVTQKATCYYGAGNLNFGKSYERTFYQASGGWTSWREMLTVNNISNPNLLINGDFQINQRGTKFDFSAIGDGAVEYTFDRWQTVRTLQTISKIKKGIKIKRTVSGGYCGVGQYIEGNYKELICKKLTLTFDFNLISGNLPYMYINAIVNGIDTNLAISFNIPSGKNSITTIPIPDGIQENTLRVGLIASTTAFEIDVYSAKLELGEIATPLSPRTYGEELELCHRYFRRLHGRSIACAIFPNQIYFPLDDLTRMRIYPTLKTSRETNDFIVYSLVNGINYTGFSLTLGDRCLIATKTNHGLTNAGIIFSDILLDAEIY